MIGAKQDGCMSDQKDSSDRLTGAFSGPTEFAHVVRDALARAAHEGWPVMVWSDPSFEDWPLGERAVVDSLQAWARGGRQLVMVATSFDAVLRHKPRLVAWRKTWDHIVECRVCKTLDASEIPSALWSPLWAMRRLDLVRCTGVAGLEPARRVLLKEELEECRRQSSPGFSATTLGL
jgi:hypothetical protein